MIKVNLVGNPNTGKTTLYNSLTHAHERVGNWHGVTVEEKVKKYTFEGKEIELCDLPGIYSLTSLSYEEKVAIDAILKEPKRTIINICDASNLERNLYLTLSLMELGANIILAVNQIEKVPAYKIDFKKLSDILGVPVVAVDAEKKVGLEKLNHEVLDYKSHKKYNLPYLKKLHLDDIHLPKIENEDFYKIKLLEGDESTLKKLNLEKNITNERVEEVAEARYDFIHEVMRICTTKNTKVYGRSKFDKFIMNRFLALPIFLCLMAGVFYLTFFSIGAWLSDSLVYLLDNFIGQPLINIFTSQFGANSPLTGLIEVAVVGGAGTVLGFLPQVALLFLFLSLLEESGYMSRVAFAIEDILGKVGLSGKSVYTLLMGFGCSTTAVLTARNMEDKNSKIKTGLLTPYMSCSAKFPIYAVLGGAFFGANNIFVIMGLYLLGVVVAVSLSYIFEKTVLKSKEQSFILEFPPYHSMSMKKVLFVLWENMKLFLLRVGSLIICMNVIVWLLSNFSFTFSYIPRSGGVSMLEAIGRVISPIFIPLGFGSWGAVSALIAGLVAKEVIVSSIAMFNNVSDAANEVIGESLKDPTSAVFFASSSHVISYLVFSLLYFPCLATASVLAKEIGKKWTFLGILIQFIVAYLVTLAIFNIARLIEIWGLLKVLLCLIAFIIVLASVVFIIKKLKNRHTCSLCPHCDKKCKTKKRLNK